MAERTEDDLLLEIAEQIEMNRVGYREKTDEEKAELIPGIKAIATKKLQEISISFNRVIGHLGDNVPEETRMLILRGISEKVSSDDKVKTIDGAFSVETVTLAENIVVSEKGKAEQQQANSTDVYYSDSGMYENEVVQNNDTNIEDRLSEDSDYGYTNLADMKKDKENVEGIFSILDEEKMDALIEQANSGDVKAQTTVMVMMTSMAYTQTTRSFETMSDVEKQDALSALENLAIVAREYDNSEARIVSREIVKYMGLEFLLTENNQGELVINEDALFKIFKDYNPEHVSSTIQGLEGMGKFYKNLDGYNDFKQETVITKGGNTRNSNFRVYIDKIISEEIKADDIIPMLDKLFEEDYDATLRAIAYRSGDTEENTEVRKLIDVASKKCFEIYIAGTRNENGLIVDDSVKDIMNEMINSSFERMTRERKPNKELIDMMLQIDPVKTQMYLKENVGPTLSKEDKTNSRVVEEKEITEEQLYQKFANVLNQMAKSRGLAKTLNYVTASIEGQNGRDGAEKIKKRYVSGAMIMLESQENSYDDEEREGRKKLFEQILSDKIYDENILKQMIEIDSTTTKEILDELLIQQNQSKENNLGTIMDLSQKMKEVSDSKVLSADNVQIEVVAEEFGKTDKFRSTPDDGMEPGD